MSHKIDGGSPQKECPETGTRETPFPARSSYVTIKLDPVKSVASVEDEEATSAAEKLSAKTYVGFVVGRRDGHDIEPIPIQAFQVRMLRPGLPRARPEEFFTSDMCIPVFPNTDHPSRAPLQPIPAIPWANAYHAAFDRVILRVGAALADEALATFLCKEERMRLALACALDYERQSDFIDKALAGDSPTSSGSVPSGAEEYATVVVTQGLRDKTPWVHMSYDLTDVQELYDPQDFFQEIEIVQQLLKDARKRQAEKLAQAIEKARMIDEAAFGCPSSMISAPLSEPITATDAASGPCTDPFLDVNPRPTLVTALGRWATRIGQAVSNK
ncbi:hypothetical protein FIBSPDRAFT_822701 [Athelia psychrophila]|uniref:Uncharacterized protein n=1 Tax=Athelia psychrophila TaxID=1759441 RepID=A0A166MFT0_9AGAM|nr:hypothetical protein FIBSPDRAFT_822701 [Fibularhizoctonia sp. CBS 109695]